MSKQLLGQALLDSLKEQGFRVNVSHNRLTEADVLTLRELREKKESHDVRLAMLIGLAAPKHKMKRHLTVPISPFGGYTEVRAEKDGKTFMARSYCAEIDTFNKHTSLTKATGRLVGELRKDSAGA